VAVCCPPFVPIRWSLRPSHYTLDTFDWQNVDCADILGETGCPGRLIERLDRRHVSNEISNLLVDPNLKPMRAQEATIGLDRELSNVMSIGVRYTHKWLDRAIEDVGVIDPVLGAEIFTSRTPAKVLAPSRWANSIHGRRRPNGSTTGSTSCSTGVFATTGRSTPA
jgi:hypothetical protein